MLYVKEGGEREPLTPRRNAHSACITKSTDFSASQEDNWEKKYDHSCMLCHCVFFLKAASIITTELRGVTALTVTVALNLFSEMDGFTRMCVSMVPDFRKID